MSKPVRTASQPEAVGVAGPADGRMRRWTLLALLILLAGGASILLWHLEMDLVQLLSSARQTPALLIASAVSYALLLALPFMPGIELGLLIMLVFGKVGALVAYLATLAGLNVAFGAGIFLRSNCLQLPSLLRWRAQALEFENQRDAVLARHRFTASAAAWLARRGGPADYLLLGLALNVPGNFLLGGGGGIALLAGLSGRLRWRWFAVTVALATCGVPLLAATGYIDLKRWLVF